MEFLKKCYRGYDIHLWFSFQLLHSNSKIWAPNQLFQKFHLFLEFLLLILKRKCLLEVWWLFETCMNIYMAATVCCIKKRQGWHIFILGNLKWSYENLNYSFPKLCRNTFTLRDAINNCFRTPPWNPSKNVIYAMIFIFCFFVITK